MNGAGPPMSSMGGMQSAGPPVFDQPQDTQFDNRSGVDTSVVINERSLGKKGNPRTADHYLPNNILQGKITRWALIAWIIGGIIGEFDLFSTAWRILTNG